jgi:hypothetical protein
MMAGGPAVIRANASVKSAVVDMNRIQGLLTVLVPLKIRSIAEVGPVVERDWITLPHIDH